MAKQKSNVRELSTDNADSIDSVTTQSVQKTPPAETPVAAPAAVPSTPEVPATAPPAETPTVTVPTQTVETPAVTVPAQTVETPAVTAAEQRQQLTNTVAKNKAENTIPQPQDNNFSIKLDPNDLMGNSADNILAKMKQDKVKSQQQQQTRYHQRFLQQSEQRQDDKLNRYKNTRKKQSGDPDLSDDQVAKLRNTADRNAQIIENMQRQRQERIAEELKSLTPVGKQNPVASFANKAAKTCVGFKLNGSASPLDRQ
ncbi:MAG: hypothetical protein LBL62_04430 [Planctomycetaceae bacterium]|jgi:hypothetical protein|nr:hypothetical protein [Planctomycetaceae bacterium]